MFQTVTHLPHIHCLIQFFKGNFKCSFQNLSLLCCDHIENWWKISELLPHSSKGNISENITEIKINLCNNDNLAPLMGPVCFTNSVLFLHDYVAKNILSFVLGHENRIVPYIASENLTHWTIKLNALLFNHIQNALKSWTVNHGTICDSSKFASLKFLLFYFPNMFTSMNWCIFQFELCLSAILVFREFWNLWKIMWFTIVLKLNLSCKHQYDI